MTTLPTVLIIDKDRPATDELTGLLQTGGLARVRMTASSVAAAVTGSGLLDAWSFDWLFIRIDQWDDWLELCASHPGLPAGAQTVVFLSGQDEKCTRHLAGEVDFHLQPPFKLSRLTAIFKRRTNPDFRPRPLDFFFLKVLCRYHAVRFADILEVRARGNLLTVRLTSEEYTVTGSLTKFQQRLRVPSERVRRGVLVIHSA